MLSRLAKLMSGSSEPSSAIDLYRHRLDVYESELGEPEHSFTDDAERRIDIHAFGRDFVPECREGSDEGYVLLTNGMSQQRMHGVQGDAIERSIPRDLTEALSVGALERRAQPVRMLILHVALHALRTELPFVERKGLPRLEAHHFVVAHPQLNPALLPAETTMRFDELFVQRVPDPSAGRYCM